MEIRFKMSGFQYCMNILRTEEQSEQQKFTYYQYMAPYVTLNLQHEPFQFPFAKILVKHEDFLKLHVAINIVDPNIYKYFFHPKQAIYKAFSSSSLSKWLLNHVQFMFLPLFSHVRNKKIYKNKYKNVILLPFWFQNFYSPKQFNLYSYSCVNLNFCFNLLNCNTLKIYAIQYLQAQLQPSYSLKIYFQSKQKKIN